MYSQNGEHLILTDLLARFPKGYSNYCVEIGADVHADGSVECNTTALLDAGWDGIIIDEDELPHPSSRRHFVTADNLGEILGGYGVPPDLGVLSIDVDGVDYWLWRSLPEIYRPAIVVIEYNSQILPELCLTVPYDPEFRWSGTTFWGASAGAMVKLAHSKGYYLVSECKHVNLFFVRDDLLPDYHKEPILTGLYGNLVAEPQRQDDRIYQEV